MKKIILILTVILSSQSFASEAFKEFCSTAKNLSNLRMTEILISEGENTPGAFEDMQAFKKVNKEINTSCSNIDMSTANTEEDTGPQNFCDNVSDLLQKTRVDVLMEVGMDIEGSFEANGKLIRIQNELNNYCIN